LFPTGTAAERVKRHGRFRAHFATFIQHETEKSFPGRVAQLKPEPVGDDRDPVRSAALAFAWPKFGIAIVDPFHRTYIVVPACLTELGLPAPWNCPDCG